MVNRILLVLLCLGLVGCNNTVKLPHPSREMAEIPLLQEMDKYLSLTGNIEWLKEGIVIGGLSDSWAEERKDFFPAFVPEEWVGTKEDGAGTWYFCPDCKKYIPCNYEKCPLCDRRMKRRFHDTFTYR